MKLVVVESPYKGETNEERFRNVYYARLCLHDCIVNHGEAPFASHLLYTQPHILRDEVPEERLQGIDAGLCFKRVVEYTVFYTDLDWSTGMKYAKSFCEQQEQKYIERKLPDSLFNIFIAGHEWNKLWP